MLDQENTILIKNCVLEISSWSNNSRHVDLVNVNYISWVHVLSSSS